MSAHRRVVYIRAVHRPPLFLRVIGGQFHPIDRLLHPDGSPHDGYAIACGDLAEVTIRDRLQRLPINEFAELSDLPDAVVHAEKLREEAKRKSARR
jgi:hypothetical protein